MRQCYFRAAAPEVEVRGNLIFIVPPDADHEVALEAPTAGRLIAALTRALIELSDRRTAEVVEFRARG